MTGFTEADFLRVVVPFLAGLVLGVWLKKPVEGVFTLAAIVAVGWGWVHQEEAVRLLEDFNAKLQLWLAYGIKEATLWVSEVLSGRVDPLGVLAFVKAIEPKWVFFAGFLGGVRA